MHEQPPSDHAYLQARTHEITAHVRELLHRPLGAAALRVEQAAESLWPMREHLRESYAGYQVPYAYADIPPDFFNGGPIQFSDKATFDAHLEDYWIRDAAWYNRTCGTVRWSEKMRSIISAGLQRKFLESTEPIDWRDWQSYEDQAKSSGGDMTLRLNVLYTSIGYRSAEESGVFNYATDKHEHSLVMSTSAMLSQDGGTGTLMRIPILHDDVAFTRRLLNATAIMMQYIDMDRKLYDDFDILLQNDAHRAFFHKHVQRTSPDGGTRELQFGSDRLQRMVQEGAQTIAGTISVLMSTIPQGYDGDKEMLIKDIIGQDIVAKMARLTPFGLIGPAGFFGRYIPDLLHAQNGRKLAFTKSGIEALGSFSKSVEADFAQLWQTYDKSTDLAPKIPVQTGTRCPFQGKERNPDNPYAPSSGVISLYSRALGKIFTILNTPTEADFIRALRIAKGDETGF